MKVALAVLCFILVRSEAQKIHSKSKYVETISPPIHSGKHETTTKACPTGYWLDGGRCVSKEEVPFTSICPAGSVDEGDECRIFSPVRFTCPHGTVLVGRECLSEEFSPKLLSCAAPAELHEKQCVLTFVTPPTCPEDTAVSGKECSRISPVQKQCPHGFSSHGTVCSRTQEAEPMLECPNGFNLEGHICSIKSFILPVCPVNTVDEGSRCATFSPKLRRCPHGFSEEGNKCIKTNSVAKNVYCANGGNPADRCKEAIQVPLSPTCLDPKAKLVVDRCEKTITRSASFSCPEGYDLVHGKCSKEIDYDCSVTKHEIECETPPKPSKPLHGHVRSLYEAKDYAKSKYMTEKAPSAPILPVCHKVPVVIPKTCQRTVSAEGTPFCAEGVYRGGSICEILEVSPPSMKCDGQTDARGNCFVEETSNPIRTCPAGYSSGHGETCIRVEFADSIYECPRNTEGERCATFHEKKCPGGNCERVLTERATVVCPEGYTKEERSLSHHQKESVVCLKTEFTDLVATCPKGAIQRGLECITLVDQQSRIERRIFPAQEQCPTGYSDKGSKCEKDTLFPATPICPDGTLYDNRCAKNVPKSVRCPKGSVSEKGKCWVFEIAEPLTVDTVVGGHKRQH